MTTFIPRRSARLAAKGSGAPVDPVDPVVPTGPRMRIEEITVVVKAYADVLEAKGAEATKIAMSNLCNFCGQDHSVTPRAIPVGPPKLTKEESRTKFLAHKGPVTDVYKNQCVTMIKQYLDDCDSSRGKTAKAVIATRLMHYLIQNPTFLAAHERFANTVIKKMEEFKQEDSIPDAVIAEEFHKTVKDVLYVTTGA